MAAYISKHIHLNLTKDTGFVEQEAELHPYLFIVLLFLLGPILMIGVLLLLTTVVVLPLSWMMGWL